MVCSLFIRIFCLIKVGCVRVRVITVYFIDVSTSRSSNLSVTNSIFHVDLLKNTSALLSANACLSLNQESKGIFSLSWHVIILFTSRKLFYALWKKRKENYARSSCMKNFLRFSRFKKKFLVFYFFKRLFGLFMRFLKIIEFRPLKLGSCSILDVPRVFLSISFRGNVECGYLNENNIA